MNNLQDDLIQAHRDGRFLDTVYELFLRLPVQEKKDLTDALVDLHNTSTIDVVAAFSVLRHASEPPDFFLTRHIFESVLPELNADVLGVMRCVIHLTKEAGQDLAAGTLIDPYIKFCVKSPLRAYEAIELIQKDTQSLADLLAPTLIAGARHNVVLYTQKAIEFSKHSDVEVRKQAVFSLGRIQYQTKKVLVNMAMKLIAETVALENDDHLLGNAVKSAFDIYKQNPSTVGQVTTIFGNALEKGADITLHAASEVFGFYTDDIPPSLLDVLLKYLVNVQSKNNRTLDIMDYGIEKLLATKNNQNVMIVFLERLLRKGVIEIGTFDSTTRLLCENGNGLLNRLTTRWLLKGEHALCAALYDIIRAARDKNLILSIDSHELTQKDSTHLIFLARKAIGYLFFYPVTATSIVLSLLPLAEDGQTKSAIIQLIFDPLLLSYNQVEDCLKKQCDMGDTDVKAAAQQAIQMYEEYVENIRNATNLSEHHPPMTNREAFMRHYSRQMQQSMREAEKQSLFRQLAKKSVLLYGRKSINYVGGPDAQNRRMEMELKKHSFSIEMPRLQNIDSFGLDYLLSIFRSEYI